jgi:hypothetical protein
MKFLMWKFVVNKGMSALMELISTNAWAKHPISVLSNLNVRQLPNLLRQLYLGGTHGDYI